MEMVQQRLLENLFERTIFMETTTGISGLLWNFWDMVDISENMHRMDNSIMKRKKGLPSAIHAGIFLVLTVVAFVAAWYFDFQSTLMGLSSITDLMIPSLPAQAAKFTWYIVFCFTIMPTLLEIFTANLAKEDIKIIQLAIILFTLFDLVTDIPRSYALAMSMWPQIELMGILFAPIVFWMYFFGILFFATIGFEIMLCMFGYCAVCYTLRAFVGTDAIDLGAYARRMQHTPRMPRSRAHARTTTDLGADDVVIIDG